MTKEEIRTLGADRFSDTVTVVDILEPSPEKVRFLFRDQSFVDIRISQKAKNFRHIPIIFTKRKKKMRKLIARGYLRISF